jgi:hypothetical protein
MKADAFANKVFIIFLGIARPVHSDKYFPMEYVLDAVKMHFGLGIYVNAMSDIIIYLAFVHLALKILFGMEIVVQVVDKTPISLQVIANANQDFIIFQVFVINVLLEQFLMEKIV